MDDVLETSRVFALVRVCLSVASDTQTHTTDASFVNTSLRKFEKSLNWL